MAEPAAAPTLADVLVDVGRRALEQPDAVALVPGDDPSGAVSRGELCRRIDACAGRLAADGLAAGDPVLYSVRPSVPSIVLLLALVACRAQIVFVDPGTGPELFARRLARVTPRWVFAESLLYAASGRTPLRPLARRRGLELPALGELDVEHVRVGAWLPGVPLRARSYRRLVRAGGPPAPILGVDPAANALVVFTSGTTSAPKAVAHTWASLGAGLDAAGRLLPLTPTDVVLTEEVHSLIPALRAGARVVLPPPGAGAADRLALMTACGVSHAFLVPADAAALLDAAHDAAQRRALGRLRGVVLGAAPVGGGLLRRLGVRAPRAQIRSVYAMTEMLPVAAVDAEDKLAHDGPGDLVGTPVPGVQVRIVDDELHVAGPALARPDLAAPVPEWYATGDLARLDAQGRIVLLGRRKAMVIRGHHNLYPGLYEPAAETVEGVRAALLVGVAAHDDERAVLLVEPLPGTDEAALPERVRAALEHGPRRIDAHARPDAVLVTPLPRSGRSAKPDRAAAAALAHDLLARAAPPRRPAPR